MAGVYDNVNELVEAVSKETGVSGADVRKVLRSSFASTHAYIARELTKQLSDSDLDKVAGGAGTGIRLPDRKSIFSTPINDV